MTKNLGWIAAILCSWPGLPHAAPVPQAISFEGRLLKADGTPETSSVVCTFTLYTSATGNTQVWFEGISVFPSANGYYAALLGKSKPLPAFDVPYWLGITVASEAEMTPRTELASVAYALRAEDAHKLGGDASSAILRTWSPLNAANLTGEVPASGTNIARLTDGSLNASQLKGQVPSTGTNIALYEASTDGSLNIVATVPRDESHVATKGYVDAQVGAAATSAQVGDLSANLGMYANRIPDMTPPGIYTEVCFKSGDTLTDVHATVTSTAGGNCLPGDIGFVIEKVNRSAATWDIAKQTCLVNNMRLPEYFELKLACRNISPWSLTNSEQWEWASNQAVPQWDSSSSHYIVAPVLSFSLSACTKGSYGIVGHNIDPVVESSAVYRCVR